MEEITGVIKSIRYANEKNGYTVCDLKTDNAVITMVGTMPLLAVGENIVAKGEFVYHADYGRQFKAEVCERKAPTREEEIKEYLSSGIIKGLGPATAEKIVEAFKELTFQILQFEPYRLTEIRGITPEKALFYGQAFLEHENMRNIVMLMQRYGVSSSTAGKVWKKYGTKAEEEIRENPYCLSEPPVALSFATCDRIALSLGFEPYSKERLKSAIRHVLSTYVSNGHTFCPRGELLKAAIKLAHVAEEFIEDALNGLLLEGRISIEKRHLDRVYPESMIQAERYCAARLISLANQPETVINDMEEELTGYEKEHSIQLDDIQKEAVKCAASHGICVITGGPGTGKTTIIRTLIHVFEDKGHKVILAAPTGRAAKRISETAGCEAKTLHRLLEVGYSIDDDERPYFMRNEDNPLECDAVIIDEASMLDIQMLNALLKALPDGSQLVLVGDADQLPSVGPGRILSDIIESSVFPVVKLETIFRQAEESFIISNAHLINQGLMPELNMEEGDFYFIQKIKGQEISDAVIELVTANIPERFGLEAPKDIQVLSPMRKGETGINHLNLLLQQHLNPDIEEKPQKVYGGSTYRLGDRVMQIRNDYSLAWTLYDEQGHMSDGLGVYNGDMGTIIDIDLKAELLTVRFDDQRLCEYRFDMLDNLEHAFAITVHKSQGSEFPCVIIPLYSVPPLLICRNLLYTAVTRAKKLVVIVGSPTILEQMVKNLNERERFSGLKERFCEAANPA